MTRRALAAAAAALAVVALAGCSTDHGTVTGKGHDPASAVSVSCGNGCSVPIVTDECWRLDLVDENGDTGSVCAPDPFVWQATPVGSHWPAPR